MQYVEGIKAYADKGKCAVTLGKFDGLHRGHQKLVDQVREYGELDAIKSVVCAFDMRARCQNLQPQKQVLMTKDERKEMLDGKVDFLVDCPFTEAMAKMEAEDFIRDVLAGIFHAAYVVVGSDFHFGHEKKGDIHMLAAYAPQYQYELSVIDKERYEDREISSTYIKEALYMGNIGLTGKLLGYPYRIRGIVEHGKKLGRTLGFPTINVMPSKEKLLPPKGVYVNMVRIHDTWYPAICNIGVKPTVADEGRVLAESYLFGYSGDAYGQVVDIALYDFVRPEKKFGSIEEMKKTIDADIRYGTMYFSKK